MSMYTPGTEKPTVYLAAAFQQPGYKHASSERSSLGRKQARFQIAKVKRKISFIRDAKMRIGLGRER